MAIGWIGSAASLPHNPHPNIDVCVCVRVRMRVIHIRPANDAFWSVSTRDVLKRIVKT